MALFHLCVDLFDGVQCDTNHNENRCTAEWEVLIGTDQHERDQREHSDHAQVQGTYESHP